ncbi:MAG: exosortase [Acidobacteriales bacterium]|nr:exosortase [Terriglobales bacterium]
MSVVMWWRPLSASLQLAWHNEEYTHIALFIPVAVGLISLQWKSVSVFSKPSLATGVVLLMIAALLGGVATRSQDNLRLSLEMFALVCWWIAAFYLCFGARLCKALLFPLCFLFWMVPLPGFLLNKIVVLLQHASASATSRFFAAAGVPVVRNGVLLSIPGLNIEVARECSSIRSSLMLLVTTMVLAHLFLRSPWRKALVILAAIPLSVAKNGLRIFTLSMLGVHVDPGFLYGNLHRNGGVVFFVIALLTVILMLKLLQTSEDGATPHAVPAGPDLRPGEA